MGNLYSGSNQTRILKRFTKDKKLARKTAHHLLWSLRSSGVSLGQQRIWRHGFYPWVRKIPWRRKWQPTPVFLPGKSHGQRRLTGYSPGKSRMLLKQLSIYILDLKYIQSFISSIHPPPTPENIF